MIALFSLAFAIDFTPTWDETTQEAPDPTQEMTTKKVVVPSTQPFDTPVHSLYVVTTVIVAGTVSHWQQGPYDTPDSTLPVQLEVPSEVRESMERAEWAHVSVTVMSTDFANEAIRREPPTPSTRMVLRDGELMGLTIANRPSASTTSEEW